MGKQEKGTAEHTAHRPGDSSAQAEPTHRRQRPEERWVICQCFHSQTRSYVLIQPSLANNSQSIAQDSTVFFSLM